MVMKDKLVKNHHKGIYFTLKKWTLLMLASATFIVAIVVPTYIVSNLSANKKASVAASEPIISEPIEVDNSGEEAEPTDDSESEDTYEIKEYTHYSK